MSITSAPFLGFVLIALILYYLIPKKVQWPFLLLLSALFVYLSCGLKMLGLLCLEATAIYIGTLVFSHLRQGKGRLCCLVITLLTGIGMLFVLKDMTFFNTLKIAVSAITGRAVDTNEYQILAPIGISYYTLSLVGYALDVYWDKYPAEKNPFRVLLFAGYFPQLTSGPITHFDTMSASLFSGHRFAAQRVVSGFERILWGCFKKMVVADRAAILVNAMFDNYTSYEGLYWIVGILFYALQLYADFSGCMDIILGVSECFDIPLPENFNTPFASLSLAEFWRRWHITMGAWFKDYLLFPLLKSSLFQRISRGARKKFGKLYGKKIPTCLGLAVVWVSIGLWHGGTAKFIIASGLLPGFFIICGEFFGPLFQKLAKLLKINTDCFSYRMFCRLRVLAAMCCSWIFVRAGSASAAVKIFKSIITGGFHLKLFVDGSLLSFGLDLYDFGLLSISLVLMILVGVWHEKGLHLRECFRRQNLAARWIILYAAVFVVIVFGIYGPAFDVSSFIYKNF